MLLECLIAERAGTSQDGVLGELRRAILDGGVPPGTPIPLAEVEPASEIVKRFGLSPPTISHHLKELANADLITTEKRGKFLVARINKKTVGAVKQMLAEVEGE